MTLVRQRRHQEPLTLSIPPPPYNRNTVFSIVGDPSPSLFSSSSSPESSPVETLNDLEKLTVLGHGSGGTVYKTRHKRTKALYALKVLRSNLNTITTTTAVEANILKQIESSFIVKCFAVFINSSDLCFVMELMEKGSLHDALLAEQVFSKPAISTLANRVLQGLRYLQEMRIVHGDIKPSNLLINEEGDIKIADFGASRIVAEGEYGSNGTCAYMSPERVDPEKWGFGGEVGFAGDVWSLGVVVLECFLGRYPLTKVGDKPDWAALICAICCSEKVEIPVSGSPEFRDFVERCLEKDWRKRGTVEELLRHPFVTDIY